MKICKALVLTVALLLPFASMADCCRRKIVDYKVIYTTSFGSGRFKEFSEEVKELINSGWQPFGSLAITRYGDPFQAMVKYEEVSE